MLTETREISNLRSQDVSKEILSDLVRKNVAEFSDKFFHFQYATLEMFKGALNNTHPFAMYFENVSKRYYITNQDIKPHILLENCPKIGVEQCLPFLFAAASFITQPFSL